MSVGSPSSLETKQIGNILIWILLAFIVFNHAVRFFAGNEAPVSPSGISSFTTGVDVSILDSLEAFRQAMGQSVQYTERFCPTEVIDVCGSTLYGVRVILGLY